MTSSPRQFYDSLSSHYDDMTAFAARQDKERAMFRTWMQAHPLRRAADMGCGSGVHAIALAGLGVETTGFDISREMLARARAHAGNAGNPRWVEGDFLSPGLAAAGAQDLILCLGNSLPHIPSLDELAATLRYWFSCLSEGGSILIQILNYERILRERERIVGVRRAGGTTIVRFYDFTEPRLTFNILILSEEDGAMSHRLDSTLLLPVTATELREAAGRAGCGAVSLFGSLSFDPLTSESRDLVALLYL